MIGFRESWQRLSAHNRRVDAIPNMLAALLIIAADNQFPVERGFCAFCGFRLSNHAPDCCISLARNAIAKAGTA